MGKGHRNRVRKDYIALIYSKNMTRRHERAVRSSLEYEEVVRLCGLEEAERLLDEAPRSWRRMPAWPRASRPL